MRRVLVSVLVPIVLTSCVLAVSRVAHGDGFIIVPEPVPIPRPFPAPRSTHFPLQVKYHDVTVTVKNQVATTEVDQVFYNPNPRDLEGTYIFPLPHDSVVAGFSMWMGGREVEAELLDKDRAREIYESIVRKMKDPALLEYMGRGLFKARVYPIPGRGETRVKLRYEQVLKAQDGLVEYRYPLNTEKFSSAPLERCRVAVTIDGKAHGLFSPSHPIDKRHQPGRVMAAYEARNVKPARDFVLYYRKDETDRAVGLTLLTHKEAGRDGYFLMLLSPDPASEDAAQPPKDVVFVLDTSGSMAGEKMDQARGALKYCVRSLGAKDRFQIVDFATGVRTFREGLVTAEKDVVAAAVTYVDGLKARGGTDIHGALTTALSMQSDKERPLMVVFLTDGEPTIGVTDAKEIEKAVKEARLARSDRDDVRLFVFGVGSDLNAVLLDRLAEANRGTREYVGERESIEVKVSSFFDKVSSPVFSDVALTVPGLDTFDIYPRPIPDLFHGAEVAIVGRYRGQGAKAMRLRGRLGGRDVEMVYEGRFGDAPRAPFLPRAFAVRKVGYLLDQIRLHGEKRELRDEVARLAREYGIVTPYTSFLIVEDNLVEGEPRRPAGRRHAAADAMGELRRRAKGFARAEREAQKAIRGGAGGRDGVTAGAPAVGASESLKKLSEGYRPLSDDAEEGLELEQTIAETGRFDKDGAQSGEIAEARQALRSLVRIVQGRAFYRQADFWVDARLKDSGLPIEKVVYLSEAYFELLKKRPDLGELFALGDRVRFLDRGRVIEVQP
ncbi:VIT domain-containing protein [Planctomycetota bacterium]